MAHEESRAKNIGIFLNPKLGPKDVGAGDVMRV